MFSLESSFASDKNAQRQSALPLIKSVLKSLSIIAISSYQGFFFLFQETLQVKRESACGPHYQRGWNFPRESFSIMKFNTLIAGFSIIFWLHARVIIFE